MTKMKYHVCVIVSHRRALALTDLKHSFSSHARVLEEIVLLINFHEWAGVLGWMDLVRQLKHLNKNPLDAFYLPK